MRKQATSSWEKRDPRAAYVSARDLDRDFTKGMHHLVSTNGLPLCASNAPCIEDSYGNFEVLPGTHSLVDWLPLKSLPAKAKVCENCLNLSAHVKPDEKGRFRRYINSHKKALIEAKFGFICACGRHVQKGDEIFYYWHRKLFECIVCGDENKDVAA